MSADLELWAKRVGYLGAIATGIAGAVHVGRKVWAKISYYSAVYQTMTELHEVLSTHGGAKKVYADLEAVRPKLTETWERLAQTIEGVREQLALNEQRWRAAHDDDQRAMFEADSQGRWIWANGTLLDLVDNDLDLQDVLGYGWLQCCSDVWREKVRHEWDTAVRDRSNMILGQIELATSKPGGRVLVKITACVMRGPAGVPLGWTGTFQRLAISFV